jgi:hypothetical protein
MCVELFAYAYRVSGERKYLEAGVPLLEQWLGGGRSPGGAFVKRAMKNGLYFSPVLFPSNSKSVGVCFPAVLQFVAAAGSETLVRGLDQRLEL